MWRARAAAALGVGLAVHQLTCGWSHVFAQAATLNALQTALATIALLLLPACLAAAGAQWTAMPPEHAMNPQDSSDEEGAAAAAPLTCVLLSTALLRSSGIDVNSVGRMYAFATLCALHWMKKPPFARTLRAVVLELVLLASAKIALPAISSSLIPGPHASATGASASDPGVSAAPAPEHVLHTAWSAVVHACGGCALLFALLTVSPHHQPPKRGQVKDPPSSSVGGDGRETQKPGQSSPSVIPATSIMVAGSRLLAAATLVVDIISGLRHAHGIQQQVAAAIAALMGAAMLALLLLNGVVAVHNGPVYVRWQAIINPGFTHIHAVNQLVMVLCCMHPQQRVASPLFKRFLNVAMMVIANGGSRAAIAGQLLGLVAAHLGTQHLLTSSEANALQAAPAYVAACALLYVVLVPAAVQVWSQHDAVMAASPDPGNSSMVAPNASGLWFAPGGRPGIDAGHASHRAVGFSHHPAQGPLHGQPQEQYAGSLTGSGVLPMALGPYSSPLRPSLGQGQFLSPRQSRAAWPATVYSQPLPHNLVVNGNVRNVSMPAPSRTGPRPEALDLLRGRRMAIGVTPSAFATMSGDVDLAHGLGNNKSLRRRASNLAPMSSMRGHSIPAHIPASPDMQDLVDAVIDSISSGHKSRASGNQWEGLYNDDAAANDAEDSDLYSLQHTGADWQHIMTSRTRLDISMVGGQEGGHEPAENPNIRDLQEGFSHRHSLESAHPGSSTQAPGSAAAAAAAAAAEAQDYAKAAYRAWKVLQQQRQQQHQHQAGQAQRTSMQAPASPPLLSNSSAPSGGLPPMLSGVQLNQQQLQQQVSRAFTSDLYQQANLPSRQAAAQAAVQAMAHAASLTRQAADGATDSSLGSTPRSIGMQSGYHDPATAPMPGMSTASGSVLLSSPSLGQQLPEGRRYASFITPPLPVLRSMQSWASAHPLSARAPAALRRPVAKRSSDGVAQLAREAGKQKARDAFRRSSSHSNLGWGVLLGHSPLGQQNIGGALLSSADSVGPGLDGIGLDYALDVTTRRALGSESMLQPSLSKSRLYWTGVMDQQRQMAAAAAAAAAGGQPSPPPPMPLLRNAVSAQLPRHAGFEQQQQQQQQQQQVPDASLMGLTTAHQGTPWSVGLDHGAAGLEKEDRMGGLGQPFAASPAVVRQNPGVGAGPGAVHAGLSWTRPMGASLVPLGPPGGGRRQGYPNPGRISEEVLVHQSVENSASHAL